MNLMAKKAKPGRPAAEEPTVGVTVKFNPRIHSQLELLADRMGNSIPEEVRVAVRERLEAKGLWPPPEEGTEENE